MSGNGHILENSFIDNKVEVSNEGITGKAFHFDRTVGKYLYNKTLKVEGEMSVSFRVNFDNLDYYQCVFSGSRNYLRHMLFAGDLLNLHPIGLEKGDDGVQYISHNIVTSRWYHIISVVKGVTTFYYADNVYIGSRDTIFAPTLEDICLGSQSPFYPQTNRIMNGYLEDIRVYDHALTDNERFDLGKAKVLDWRFNNCEEPTKNLTFPLIEYSLNFDPEPLWDQSLHVGALFVENWGSGFNAGMANGNIGYHAHCVLLRNEIVAKFINKNLEAVGVSNRWMAMEAPLQEPLRKNTTYTISWKQISETLIQGASLGVHHYETGNPSKTFGYCKSPLTLNTVLNVWEQLDFTFTTNDDYVEYSYNRLYVYGMDGLDGGTMYIKDIQIEEKDHYTEHINNERLGKITDHSEFNNTGVIELSSSPKYITEPYSGYRFKTDREEYIKSKNNISVGDKITITALYKILEHINYSTPICIESEVSGSGVISISEISSHICVNTAKGNIISDELAALDKVYHVAATYDKTTKLVELFIDTELVTSGILSDPIVFNADTFIYSGLDPVGSRERSNIEVYNTEVFHSVLDVKGIKDSYEQAIKLYSDGIMKVNNLEDSSDDNLFSLHGLDESDLRGISHMTILDDTSFEIKNKNAVGTPSELTTYILDLLEPIGLDEEFEISFYSIHSSGPGRDVSMPTISELEIVLFDVDNYVDFTVKAFSFSHEITNREAKFHRIKTSNTTGKILKYIRFDNNQPQNIFIFKNIKITKVKKNSYVNKKRNTVMDIVETKRMDQTNLLDYSCWKPGTDGTISYYYMNSAGLNDDCRRIIKQNPWGILDTVWACEYNDPEYDCEGGWTPHVDSYIPINKTKLHRMSVWVKRENMVDTVQGADLYMGLSPDGVVFPIGYPEITGNVYCHTSDVNFKKYENDWVLLVYYIYPAGTTSFDITASGLYSMCGHQSTQFKKHNDVCFTNEATVITVRHLFYYTTYTDEKCYW